MTAPLAGLRVLELARILAGPWMGQVLADLGADVIKVESPEGDDTRRWGPPFIPYKDGSGADAAYFHCCNRGKRSVVADFHTPAGLAVVRALAQRADVLIENFKVGSLQKHGLDCATLSASNPGLVYCSISGFGQDGPYAARPGYDAIIQAMSGIMELTGEPDGSPQKVGLAIADIFAGLYGVVAVQAALATRERTGRGQHVDLALLDSMVGVLANQNLNYLVSGRVPGRLGTAHPNIAPYQALAVRDGHIMVAVGNDQQFRRLCQAIDAPELAADPRFASNSARVNERNTLATLLGKHLAQLERADVLARLEAQGVPAGPINTLADVFADPQVIHRHLRVELDAPWLQGGKAIGVASPIRFPDGAPHSSRPPPRLGQHTDEVLLELARDGG